MLSKFKCSDKYIEADILDFKNASEFLKAVRETFPSTNVSSANIIITRKETEGSNLEIVYRATDINHQEEE